MIGIGALRSKIQIESPTFSCDMIIFSPGVSGPTPVSVMLCDPEGLPSPLLILFCVTPRTKNQIEIFQFLLLDFTTSAVIRTEATTITNYNQELSSMSINPLRQSIFRPNVVIQGIVVFCTHGQKMKGHIFKVIPIISAFVTRSISAYNRYDSQSGYHSQRVRMTFFAFRFG